MLPNALRPPLSAALSAAGSSTVMLTAPNPPSAQLTPSSTLAPPGDPGPKRTRSISRLDKSKWKDPVPSPEDGKGCTYVPPTRVGRNSLSEDRAQVRRSQPIVNDSAGHSSSSHSQPTSIPTTSSASSSDPINSADLRDCFQITPITAGSGAAAQESTADSSALAKVTTEGSRRRIPSDESNLREEQSIKMDVRRPAPNEVDDRRGQGDASTPRLNPVTEPRPCWTLRDAWIVPLGDTDRWLNPYVYLPKFCLIATTDRLKTLKKEEDPPGGQTWDKDVDLLTISVHHRVFLSHRFGIASDDLDELNKMIEMLSPPRKWHDWHLLVRVGAPVEDNKEAQRHLELIQLYYESMSTLPHFKRGGHPGGEDGVDAAPWGVRWEEDRKKTRLLFKEQRGEALIFSRARIHTVEQINATLVVLEESLADDPLEISRRPGPPPAPLNNQFVELVPEVAHDESKKTTQRALVCQIIGEVAKYQAGIYAAQHRLTRVKSSGMYRPYGKVISLLLLGVPLMYIRRIKNLHQGIAGNNKHSWNAFFALLVGEWASTNIISSLILASAVSMITADAAPFFTHGAAFFTSILSIASLVLPIFLSWTHSPGRGRELMKIYFNRSPGHLAIMNALPVSLLLWALLTFLVAIFSASINQIKLGRNLLGWMFPSTTIGISIVTLGIIIFIVWFFMRVLSTDPPEDAENQKQTQSQSAGQQAGRWAWLTSAKGWRVPRNASREDREEKIHHEGYHHEV